MQPDHVVGQRHRGADVEQEPEQAERDAAYDRDYIQVVSEFGGYFNCLDRDEWVDPGEVPRYEDRILEASPTFGRVFAWGMAGCRGVDVTSSEEPLTIRLDGTAVTTTRKNSRQR